MNSHEMQLVQAIAKLHSARHILKELEAECAANVHTAVMDNKGTRDEAHKELETMISVQEFSREISRIAAKMNELRNIL